MRSCEDVPCRAFPLWEWGWEKAQLCARPWAEVWLYLQSLWEFSVEIKDSAHVKVKTWALGVFQLCPPPTGTASPSLSLSWCVYSSKDFLPFMTLQASLFFLWSTQSVHLIWVENYITVKKTNKKTPTISQPTEPCVCLRDTYLSPSVMVQSEMTCSSVQQLHSVWTKFLSTWSKEFILLF